MNEISKHSQNNAISVEAVELFNEERILIIILFPILTAFFTQYSGIVEDFTNLIASIF